MQLRSVGMHLRRPVLPMQRQVLSPPRNAAPEGPAPCLAKVPALVEQEIPMTERIVCFRCGQAESHDNHGKAYGSGSYILKQDGTSEITIGEPYQAPWQHPFESATLVRETHT